MGTWGSNTEGACEAQAWSPARVWQFVYQAVHMIFNGNFEDRWEPGEKRESKVRAALWESCNGGVTVV